MFLLVGERVYSQAQDIGSFECALCGKAEPFCHITETNYFCLFGIRLLKVDQYANYYRCERCGNSYLSDSPCLPSQVESVQNVIAYILLGYGKYEAIDLAKDIAVKVSNFAMEDDTLKKLTRQYATADDDFLEQLRRAAFHINLLGKQQIIEAAFLATHACCGIQFEDKTRINLMGNALGVSIEFVNQIVKSVRANDCYGIRRLLPTAPTNP